jgi:hypothetical protein
MLCGPKDCHLEESVVAIYFSNFILRLEIVDF